MDYCMDYCIDYCRTTVGLLYDLYGLLYDL